MRHIYLLANLDREDAAQKLTEEVKRHLEGREDLRAPARVFSKRGRVSVEGVPQRVAVELQKWCAEKLKELEPSASRPVTPVALDGVYPLSAARNLLRLRTGRRLLRPGKDSR